jgi:FkbM family methyltransferase
MQRLRSFAARLLPSWALDHLRKKRRRHRSLALIQATMREYPSHVFRALDIGARFGIDRDSIFRRIRNHSGMFLVGIEPDKVEAERLMTGIDGPYAQILQVAVGDKVGTRTLYLTKHPGCSSILPPAPGAVDAFACRDFFAVTSTTQIELTTIDALFADKAPFDFVKIDVQGAEYEVLTGGCQTFSVATGINLEAQLTPLYSDQALFPAIHDRMSSMGFHLINLEPRDSIYDGEVVEVECGYIRQLSPEPTITELLNHLLFACLYDNIAYAQLLLRQGGPAAFGHDAASRIAHAARLSMATAATPAEWLRGISAPSS